MAIIFKLFLKRKTADSSPIWVHGRRHWHILVHPCVCRTRHRGDQKKIVTSKTTFFRRCRKSLSLIDHHRHRLLPEHQLCESQTSNDVTTVANFATVGVSHAIHDCQVHTVRDVTLRTSRKHIQATPLVWVFWLLRRFCLVETYPILLVRRNIIQGNPPHQHSGLHFFKYNVNELDKSLILLNFQKLAPC